MFRPRIIPCLLLKDRGLVKTIKFKKPRYVGDPMNAVRIFNKKMADELIFLDIMATEQNRIPDLDLLKRIGEECTMPFAVGGGIKSMKDIESIFNIGAEKVVINSSAVKNPKLFQEAASYFGKQAVIASIDVKKNIFGNPIVYVEGGKKSTGINPTEFAKIAEENGAGEIFLNSIDRDGTYSGLDLKLINDVSSTLEIPVIACGGASKLDDLKIACTKGNAFAAAAGSLFVFHGKKHAVLINYPSREKLKNLFNPL